MPAKIEDAVRNSAIDEMVRLEIKGMSSAEMSNILGFHPNTIKKWRNSAEYKSKLLWTKKLVYEKTEDAIEASVKSAAARAAVIAVSDVSRIIEDYSLKAVHKIADKMESENDHIALKAAIDMADRNPMSSKTRRVQSTHLHAVMTPDALALLGRTARELLPPREIIVSVPAEGPDTEDDGAA